MQLMNRKGWIKKYFRCFYQKSTTAIDKLLLHSLTDGCFSQLITCNKCCLKTQAPDVAAFSALRRSIFNLHSPFFFHLQHRARNGSNVLTHVVIS